MNYYNVHIYDQNDENEKTLIMIFTLMDFGNGESDDFIRNKLKSTMEQDYDNVEYEIKEYNPNGIIKEFHYNGEKYDRYFNVYVYAYDNDDINE